MITERIPYEVTATLTLPETARTMVVEASSEEEAASSAFAIWHNVLVIKGPIELATGFAQDFKSKGLSATVALRSDADEEERVKRWGTAGIVWTTQKPRSLNFEKLRLDFGGFTPLGEDDVYLQIVFETIDWAANSWIRQTIQDRNDSALEVGLVSVCTKHNIAFLTVPNRNRQSAVDDDLATCRRAEQPWVEYRIATSEKDAVVPNPGRFSGVLTAERADHKTRQYDVTFGAWARCMASGVIEATSSSEAGRIAEEKLRNGDTGFLREYDGAFFAADEWSLDDVAIAS